MMEDSKRYSPKEYYYMARLRKGDSLSYDLNRLFYIGKWAELLQHAWWRERREYKVEAYEDYNVVRVTRIN